MIRRMILVFFLACLSVFAVGFTIDESIIDEGVNPVEDFCRRTIRRFNDAWLLSDIEFDRAKYAASKIPEDLRDQATQYVKEAVDKAVNNAVDKAIGQAVSSGGQSIPQTTEAVKKAVDGQAK